MIVYLSMACTLMVLFGIVFEKDWIRDVGLIGSAAVIAYSVGMIADAIVKNIP